MTRLSLTLPRAIHQRARMDAARRLCTLSASLAEIIETRVEAGAAVGPPKEPLKDAVRPSVMLPDTVYADLCAMAGVQDVTPPALASIWIIEQFARRRK